MSLTKGDSTAFCFCVKPVYKNALLQYYEFRPWVAASEKFLIYPFNAGPSSNGLDIIGNFPMINCKEVDLLFPHYPTDTTYQFNPCLEQFYVQMLGKNYPNINTSMVSVDHFKAQRSACILDGVWECTESFENSQTVIPTYEFPIRDRIFGDNTEHIIKTPLERVNANSFFFDGISSVNE
jgi:hypothetical protein